MPYTGPAVTGGGRPWWSRWVSLHQQPSGTSFPTIRVLADGCTVVTGDAEEDIYVAGRAYPLRYQFSGDLKGSAQPPDQPAQTK